ncbi:unnamed protein product [Polarella glacialis]|uniref:Phospholipid/glycerol acyltransferase domain-containing protein n=1 Tax=Polarella glacialis TaxID=89957 RepID=A0A813I2B9_POLGL|nr:unnamed protein product [Polarella glacialis]
MEKFRQFGDGGTGVNPFTPLWCHHKASSLPMRLLKAVVLVPLGLLKFCVFATAIIWLILTELLCKLLSPIPLLRRPIHWFLNYAGCSMALLGLGFWFTAGSNEVADHRRLKILPPKAGRQYALDAKRGTIVLANLQGLTDVLYLGMKLCPTFVFPAADGSPVAFSILGALRRAGARRATLPPGKPQTLAEIAETARSGWCPVVVFAEGARTNGSCVLAWKPKTFEGLESFEKPCGTALVALEYNKFGAYTPHHTVGTAFRHPTHNLLLDASNMCSIMLQMP